MYFGTSSYSSPYAQRASTSSYGYNTPNTSRSYGGILQPITEANYSRSYSPYTRPILIDTSKFDLTTPRGKTEKYRSEAIYGNIHRGRTVVRLNTKKQQQKNKTPGELLIEKFTIKDKKDNDDESDYKKERQERLAKGGVIKRHTSIGIKVAQVTSEHSEEENSSDMTRLAVTNNNGRRKSEEMLKIESDILDSLILEELSSEEIKKAKGRRRSSGGLLTLKTRSKNLANRRARSVKDGTYHTKLIPLIEINERYLKSIERSSSESSASSVSHLDEHKESVYGGDSNQAGDKRDTALEPSLPSLLIKEQISKSKVTSSENIPESSRITNVCSSVDQNHRDFENFGKTTQIEKNTLSAKTNCEKASPFSTVEPENNESSNNVLLGRDVSCEKMGKKVHSSNQLIGTSTQNKKHTDMKIKSKNVFPTEKLSTLDAVFSTLNKSSDTNIKNLEIQDNKEKSEKKSSENEKLNITTSTLNAKPSPTGIKKDYKITSHGNTTTREDCQELKDTKADELSKKKMKSPNPSKRWGAKINNVENKNNLLKKSAVSSTNKECCDRSETNFPEKQTTESSPKLKNVLQTKSAVSTPDRSKTNSPDKQIIESSPQCKNILQAKSAVLTPDRSKTNSPEKQMIGSPLQHKNILQTINAASTSDQGKMDSSDGQVIESPLQHKNILQAKSDVSTPDRSKTNSPDKQITESSLQHKNILQAKSAVPTPNRSKTNSPDKQITESSPQHKNILQTKSAVSTPNRSKTNSPDKQITESSLQHKNILQTKSAVSTPDRSKTNSPDKQITESSPQHKNILQTKNAVSTPDRSKTNSPDKQITESSPQHKNINQTKNAVSTPDRSKTNSPDKQIKRTTDQKEANAPRKKVSGSPKIYDTDSGNTILNVTPDRSESTCDSIISNESVSEDVSEYVETNSFDNHSSSTADIILTCAGESTNTLILSNPSKNNALKLKHIKSVDVKDQSPEKVPLKKAMKKISKKVNVLVDVKTIEPTSQFDSNKESALKKKKAKINKDELSSDDNTETIVSTKSESFKKGSSKQASEIELKTSSKERKSTVKKSSSIVLTSKQILQKPNEEKSDEAEESSTSEEESSTEEETPSEEEYSSTSSCSCSCGMPSGQEDGGSFRTSTSSNDSGISSNPSRLATCKQDCDVNCHRKCEKLMPNLCGVNQKLVVEALTSLKRGPRHAISKQGLRSPARI